MIELEGVQELFVNLDKNEKAATRAAMQGLKDAGLNIIADAKDNLKGNHSVVTGKLRASGKVQKDKDGGVDAGFFSAEGQQGYAAAVEFGRGPTKKASPDGITLETSLKAWVHRKLGVPYGKDLDNAAFLIARKIHRKGTKAQPFFVPAVKKFEDKIQQIVDRYIKKEIR